MPSNLLLLDEPTNHLDIPAREAIESFLRETPATVLVVSHDRRLLETICDRLWVVADGLAAPFDGGYRAWRAAIAEGWTVGGGRRETEAKRLRVGGSGAGVERRRRAGGGHAAGAGGVARSRARAAAVVGAGGASGPRAGPRPRRCASTGPARRPASGGSRYGREAKRSRSSSKDAYRRQKATGGGGADAPGPAQEPPRDGDRHARHGRELRRAAPDHERACGRRHGP